MKSCVVCGSKLTPVISFGRQPIANNFLAQAEFQKEYFFELKLSACDECKMVQIEDQPAPEQMFNEKYAFFSGTSHHMGMHFKKFADQMWNSYLSQIKDPLVIEIGSNDGIMIKNFKERGVRHLGIEPSANVAKVAMEKGIDTWVRFFNEETAKEIVSKKGRADAFTAANVMCHIESIVGVVKGIDILMSDRGIVAFEDPYLGDVLSKISYDQVYDEHKFLFSATSVQNLFGKHGFELVDVEPQETHGGSMRYYLARKNQREVSERAKSLLQKERTEIYSVPNWKENFRLSCERSKKEFVDLLKKIKSEGKRVVGYAATSKSTTVLNYCGVGPDLIQCIYDSTPLKQGKFSPGAHIPILPSGEFQKNYPDYTVLFGWNHKKEILEKEREYTDRGGKWIVFVPEVAVLQ
jgi:methylation protein EvaC